MLQPRPSAPGLRAFQPEDVPACFAVFRAAVHQGAARHYTPAERTAWAPMTETPADWHDRLADQITFVAGGKTGVDGFLTLGHDGHIDLFYVTPRVMGTGVALALYRAAESRARRDGHDRMTTEASHLARAFLTRQGWTTEARQSVIRHSVPITNFRMFLDL